MTAIQKPFISPDVPTEADQASQTHSEAAPPRRIVLCMGVHCNANEQAQACYDRLHDLLGYPNPLQKAPVKWTVANCVDRCRQGPNLMVYPEGIHCDHMDAETLEDVIDEYIAPHLEKA